MTEQKLAPEQVEELYRQHAAALRRFLLGVLRDRDRADEALQQTFIRVMEKGHTADAESMRGWIYKVAFHSAMALRRQQAAGDRAVANLALDPSLLRAGPAADQDLLADEDLRRARAALGELPEAQREVVRRRFVEGQTFAQIATALGVPLGTALTRMRLALDKLRRRLEP
ncbi:MAG: RNA polymerase sigma factor [Planctomycetes bacterium]|nr:RNA polymerase sigma factor [Planctomycetota bacterium]MCB9872126.1 RNA polymerase sigma factor [Planctomycetota bacterium]